MSILAWYPKGNHQSVISNQSSFMDNSKKFSWKRKKTTSTLGSKKARTYAPLLSEEQKQSASIQDLSYDFACRITRLFQYLTENSIYKEYIMSKQVFRSGTSIGANIREAQHAQSDADFLSKMQISLKECNETDYWLQLLHDNGYLNDAQFDSINTDRVRLHKLLNAIVSTTRRKIGK